MFTRSSCCSRGGCQATSKVDGAVGYRLPPTTLTAAMGTWRPPANDGTKQLGIPKAVQNPPTTITGVAPWAFQKPRTPGGSQVARGVEPALMDGQEKAPPLHTLKRPLPCDPAALIRPNGTRAADVPVSDTSRTAHTGTRGNEDASAGSSVPVASTAHAAEDGRSEKVTGAGLRRVREFVKKIKPQQVEGQSSPSWRGQQLEPTPTLLPNLRYAYTRL